MWFWSKTLKVKITAQRKHGIFHIILPCSLFLHNVRSGKIINQLLNVDDNEVIHLAN